MPTPAEITRHTEFDPTGMVHVGPPPVAETVEIVEPDPAWPALYERLAGEIRGVLGERVLSIVHVGSTSVPGLPAKPVIDIDLTVADTTDEPAYVPDLQRIGYALRVHEPGWYEHRCLTLAEPRVNLHVFGPDCPEVVRNTMFRDWLGDHPDDRARYAAVKRASADAANAAGETMMQYNQRKQAVIREILERIFRAHGLVG